MKPLRLAVLACVLLVSTQCQNGSLPAPVTPILVAVLKPGSTGTTPISATTAADEFFRVSSGEVNTGIFISPGTAVPITSWGLVDFGGAVLGLGAPILNADGDNSTTPADYPAPALKKNSLICKVGTVLMQCGTSTTITPSVSGMLSLLPNDKDPSDNSRSWVVTVASPTGPLTRFEVLPSGGVVIDVDAPYNPSDIDVAVNGAALVRLPSGTSASPSNDPVGWYTVDITTPSTGPARWRTLVRAPDGVRSGSGFEVEITHVNGSARSAPLRVGIARTLTRGSIPAITSAIQNPGDTTADNDNTLLASDPLASSATPKAVVSSVTMGPAPSGLAVSISVSHKDPTNAEGSGNQLLGMEVEGDWMVLVSGLPQRSSSSGPFVVQVSFTINWVSQP